MGKMKRVIAAVVLLSGCAVWAQAEEFPFRQGENDYSGGHDVTITENTDWLSNNPDRLRMKYDYPSGPETFNVLIRFEGIEDLLHNTYIDTAKITLTWQYENVAWTTPAIDIHPVLKPWSDPNVSWDYADSGTGLAWEIPGAQGASDRGSGITNPMRERSFVIGNYTDGETFEFTLDSLLVQQWIDHPETNYGVILVMNHDAKSDVTFSSNEEVTLEDRPLLTITTLCKAIPGDVDRNCYVNMLDLNQMIEEWLLEEDLTADLSGDGIVNLEDLSYLGRYWLECSKPDDPECDWTGP